MSVDLVSDSGATLSLRSVGWGLVLMLAEEYGWEPEGTEPPPQVPRAEWDASYETEEGQRVSRGDAANMAQALRSMLGDPRRHVREARLLEELEEGVRALEIAELGEEEVGPPPERIDRLPMPETWVMEVIAFLESGGFRLGVVSPFGYEPEADTGDGPYPPWTCDDCASWNPGGALVCDRCGSAPEDSLLLRCEIGGAVAAVVAHLAFLSVGARGRGFLFETLFTAIAFSFLAHCATKIVQKVRAPRRRIFDEVVSAFADRWSRILLVVLASGLAWWGVTIVGFLASGGRLPAGSDPAWFALFREIRMIVLLAFGFLAIPMILRQGPRFFDPRVVSTFQGRRFGR